MSIMKTRAFAKDAKSEGLTDEALKDAMKEVRMGLVDAELGGNLVKKRIAIGSRGKSGGLRTILVYKTSAANIFCVYVFAKKDSDNISNTDLQKLKLLAKTFLGMKEEEIKKALKTGALQEVIEDEID
jgi:hypothetical protein